MKYRVAQIALIVFGVLFLIAPTHLHNTGGGSAAAFGTIMGLVIRITIVVACFVWA